MFNELLSSPLNQGKASVARLQVRAVTTPDEIERLRPCWEALNWHPNVQIDFFCEINKLWKNLASPHILVLERDGKPQGLLVGRITTQAFKCNLGYKSVSLGQVRQLTILYGGVLGCDDLSCAQLMIGELNRMLENREVDAVFFNLLDTASHLFRIATRNPGFFVRDHLVTPQLHWKVGLPATLTGFLQRLNKKHRYWLKRLEKQLDKEFPGRVSFRSLTDGHQRKEMMNDVECVARKTYQRRLGVEVNNVADDALEEKMRWERVYVIYIANRPCAFWMGRLYKGTFYSDATGYDPEYRKHELGTVVFMRMIDRLCREGVETIDFGLGDALYKQRFGDQSWSEAGVRIFSPSRHGVMINLARTSLEGSALCLKFLLDCVHLKQRLKAFWRKRL